jgi:redox-sensitive bicupin YhaK (pirin superfamily)
MQPCPVDLISLPLMTSDIADIEAIVVPRTADLGDGFTVRRVLPSAQQRAVGPFVFFDQMAAELRAGQGLDVRPHPHIGLATVTYLFEGEILHRDSLGTVQPIRPGEVNWMTAGRGIVHSERTPSELRTRGSRLSGIQVWVALPRSQEEAEPEFAHHAASELPAWEDAGTRVRLIVGHLAGVRSRSASTPRCSMPTSRSMAQATRSPNRRRAAYIVDGRIRVSSDPQLYEPGGCWCSRWARHHADRGRPPGSC